MIEFSKPEYQPYITLCQEINLEHTLALGDLAWSLEGWPAPFLVTETKQFIKVPIEGLWWLPTLSDWLQMLEEVGLDEYKCDGFPKIGYKIEMYFGMEDPPVTGRGQTREEATARLWMQVKK